MDEKGVWNFSPVYDVTFSNGPGGEHSTMYMGEGKHPTSEHLLELAKKHGIKKADAIIENVKQARDKWKIFAEKAKVSKKSQESIAAVIKGL